MKTILMLILIVVLPAYAQAQDAVPLACRGVLTAGQRELVKESKALLSDAHRGSLEETVEGINRTNCPAVQVLVLAAAARTYADLIREYDLKDKDARERLYNKIQMNMAYLQFTAGKTRGDSSSLNRLIRQKLTYYLPKEVLDHPAFYVSVDY